MTGDLPLSMRSLARLGRSTHGTDHTVEPALHCARNLQRLVGYAARGGAEVERAEYWQFKADEFDERLDR